MRLPFAEPSAEELAIRAKEGTSPPNLQLAIAHAPNVARAQLELVRAVCVGIAARDRELIMLLVGLVTENAYCWGHHVPPALVAGMTEQQLRTLRTGDHSLFPPREQALLAYCEAVVQQRVGDDIWEAVREGRSDEEMVKITMMIGFYTMLGKVQAALNIPQDEGFGGFEQP